MFQELTGTEYLKAEIACKHDKAFEKETWDDRLAHFDTLDLTSKAIYKHASDPIGLRAAIEAYNTTMAGQPTGYMVSLDACSSGLQILSLLVSCPVSFNLCGGISDRCVDSYTTIYDSMNLHGALTRKQVKAPIMTSLYGSVAMPELTLGLQELWDKIPGPNYDWVMPDNFHACIETMDKELIEFKFMGKPYAVKQKVNARPEFHKGLGPNLIHSVDGMVVREMFRRCMFNETKIVELRKAIMIRMYGSSVEKRNDPLIVKLWDLYVETGFLSVRILELLDASTLHLVDVAAIQALLDSLPKKPFDVVSVHDCFRAHPNYGNDLRRQYNTILADINDSTLLQYLCQQVSNSKMQVKKLGTIPRNVVLESS